MIGLYGHLQRFELSWDPQWVNVEAEVQQIAQSPPYGLHPPVLYIMESDDVDCSPK